jgi:oligo-1,6-glucosidase
MKKYLSTIAILVIAGFWANAQSSLITKKGTDKKWWKEAIVYQIYPRSFIDSDGDGIGDLKGIISQLDYIKSLGVNAVWLNPIYSSPNDDNGYDVSDYRNIMKDFGTMADFDLLLKGLHARGIKLVMDFVLNHSSDEHEWFKQSKSSRTSPYRNYYHWWDAERVKPNYRYSLFDVNHNAWKFDTTTNAFYLHYFSQKQPDLNWENPKVRKEIYAIMKFWADKGIDGYRLDAFQFSAKDTSFPAFPNGFEKNFVKYYAMGPHLHDYLKEMNQEVFSKYDVMTVAEGAGNNFQDAHDLVDAERKELNMAYAFDAIDMAKMEGYDFIKFKETFSRWDSVFAQKGWLSIFLASHDQARIVNRFGNASPAFRELSSKMLSTLLLTMRGTPYIYNGDELAMTNAGFQNISDYRDMPTLNEYQYQINHGGNMDQFMKRIQFESRDNARTPFQWDDTFNAGFSTGTPWIQVNANYKIINKAAQETDPQSVLNYFRKLTALRHQNPALVYGKYQLLDKSNPDVFAYTRELDGKKFLVLLNFSKHQAKLNISMDLSNAKTVLTNYPKQSINGSLAPYESIVYKLK